MVGIAISTTLGLVLGAIEILSIEKLIVATLFFLLIAGCAIRSRIGGLAVLGVVASTAALHFSICSSALISQDTARLFSQGEGRSIKIIGRIANSPEYKRYGRDGTGMWSFAVDCEGIHIGGVWRRVRGSVDVNIFNVGNMSHVERGQRIRVGGSIHERLFPGRNAYELKVADQSEIQPLQGGRRSFLGFGKYLREAGANRLEAGMEQHAVQQAVLKALVLGYREQMPKEVMDCFRRTGAFHIFAISGLHVGIVGLIFAIFLKAFGLPRDKFWMVLIPLLALYVASTGMKSSALRALTMAAVFLLSPLFRRNPDIPTSVAFAAILLLVIEPLDILSAGFIFSFIVVSFIVMVYAYLPSRWIQGKWVKQYGVSLLITSIAASLASIPLAALYFGRFSPIALIGNLLVVPLTFCIVLCGWLSMLVPFCSSIFNHAALLFINLLLGSVEWLDVLPGSSWAVTPPPLVAVLLWYGSLIFLFTHAKAPLERRYGLVAAGCAVVLCVIG